jgi:hypothetical protein
MKWDNGRIQSKMQKKENVAELRGVMSPKKFTRGLMTNKAC